MGTQVITVGEDVVAVVETSRQLRFKELKSLKGICETRMTIWRWEQLGLFPKRHRTPMGRIFWWEHEVDAWLANLECGGGNRFPEKKAGTG